MGIPFFIALIGIGCGLGILIVSIVILVLGNKIYKKNNIQNKYKREIVEFGSVVLQIVGVIGITASLYGFSIFFPVISSILNYNG